MVSLTPPIRLCSVLGYGGRVNDVVFCPPAIKSDDNSTVVYFGGDVQDFPEVMKLHIDNKNYIKWNLENMAAMLNISFPYSHIIVVRPSKIEFRTFSCYKNFVRSGKAGVPEHTPTHYALQHLERLLQGVSQRVKTMTKLELRDIISSIRNQEYFTDSNVLQVSVESFNPKSREDNSAFDNIKSTQFKTSEKMTDNSTSLNLSEEETIKQKLRLEYLTVANTKVDNVNLNEIRDTNDQTSVIQTLSSDIGAPDIFDSSQCQSAVVINPHSSFSNQVHGEIKNRNNIDLENNDCIWWHDNLALDKTKLILIGFSKGCVVLNQLIYEFHYLKTLTPDDTTMLNFVSRISDMFWLDGGHAGGKNTWITSRSLLETLTRLGIKIWVHVTPYQVQDDRRAWIRREEQAFTELLQRLGAQVTRTLHFDGATPDLHMHFDILNVFRHPGDGFGQCINK